VKAFKISFFDRNLEQPSPQLTHTQAELQRLLGLLPTAMGPGMAEEIGALLQMVASNSDQIERGVSAWIGLIEVLVQSSERRQRKGGGSLKKAEVKSAMHDILSSSRFQLPSIPRYLQPVVIDFFVDWSIDALVSAANGYQLWDYQAPEPPSFRTALNGLLRRAVGLLRPFFECVAALVAWIYVQLRYWAPLTPELREALDKVERDGLITNKQALMRSGTELVIFVGQHGKEVTALFQLVFEAVREAEFVAGMSGPQKKEYATSLILAVLQELGFPISSPLFSAIARAVISGAIESALNIFKKRAPETFQRPSTQASGAEPE
jgi:hypothetical protein